MNTLQTLPKEIQDIPALTIPEVRSAWRPSVASSYTSVPTKPNRSMLGKVWDYFCEGMSGYDGYSDPPVNLWQYDCSNELFIAMTLLCDIGSS